MDHTSWYLLGQYIFPLKSGSSWQYGLSWPTIPNYVTVTGPSDITVGNNSFANAWHVYGNAGVPDASFAIDEWFEDHVGFVKKYINTFGEFLFTRHNLDWYLVSYELK
jgi:hypothetical protein